MLCVSQCDVTQLWYSEWIVNGEAVNSHRYTWWAPLLTIKTSTVQCEEITEYKCYWSPNVAWKTGFHFIKILRIILTLNSSWHSSLLILLFHSRTDSVFGQRRMSWLLPSSHYASELIQERDLSIAIVLHLIFCRSRIMYPCWIINEYYKLLF